MPPFTFDFTLKQPNMEYVPEQEQTVARAVKGTGNLCPYPIPTIDEIIKMIEKAKYTVDTSKLISDVFECGALAISNLVDKPKFDEREQRYLDIIKSYKPTEQKLIVDIFSKIFALLSSVVYDNGTFNDYLGELFMRCNQGNKHAGQFFTPYHISHFMASAAFIRTEISKTKF